jgi:prevent-host-death family protein
VSDAINVHEAKTHLSRLLDRAHAGEEIILAKGGKPYARLMPLAAAPGPRQPGRLGGRIDDSFFDPLPEEELAAWEGRTPDPLLGSR